jgi:hypothetical protein
MDLHLLKQDTKEEEVNIYFHKSNFKKIKDFTSKKIQVW